jgi:hypothetical protein
MEVPTHLANVLGCSGATCLRLYDTRGIRVSRYSDPKVSLKSFRPDLELGYCLVLALKAEGSRQLFRLGKLIHSTPSERGAVDVFEMDNATELLFRPPFDYLVIEVAYSAQQDPHLGSRLYGRFKDSADVSGEGWYHHG